MVVIKELIWQEYLQSSLIDEKKYGNFLRPGPNILSPDKRLNCEIVTI